MFYAFLAKTLLKQFLKLLYGRFRTATDFRSGVVLGFPSFFLILIFEVLVSHLFDVIRHSPYFEEEDDLQYSEY